MNQFEARLEFALAIVSQSTVFLSARKTPFDKPPFGMTVKA